jgi:hypothetical protein
MAAEHPGAGFFILLFGFLSIAAIAEGVGKLLGKR